MYAAAMTIVILAAGSVVAACGSTSSAGRETSALAAIMPASGADDAHGIPAPTVDLPRAAAKGEATAVFAGGCFWGVESVYEHVKGVKNVVSGYAGGDAATARYDRVSDGDTGHAESVRITYDPSQITYGTLLQIFFSVVHDPTQLNRQGPDIGTQYRSAVFVENDDQKRVAEAYIAQLGAANVYSSKIVTKIEPAGKFYTAEEYHQNYAELNPNNAYVRQCEIPKLGKLKKLFPELWVEGGRR